MVDIKDIMGPFYRPLSEIRKIEVIPTNIKLLDDYIIGIGGLPRGQGVEISGKTHSGKSTLCLNIAKAVQKAKGEVLWYSIGEALDKDYARKIGVDIERMVVPPYSSADNMFQQIKLWLAYNVFDLIVIDCLDAIRPESIQDNPNVLDDMNDKMIKVKLISSFVNSLTGGYQIKDLGGKNTIISNEILPMIKDGKVINTQNIHYIEQKKACLIFINREKDVVGRTFGPKTYSGGGADKGHLITIKLLLSADSGEKRTEGGEKVLEYRDVRIVNKTNKAGGEPFRVGIVRMYPNGKILEIDKDELIKKKGKKKLINPLDNEEKEDE